MLSLSFNEHVWLHETPLLSNDYTSRQLVKPFRLKPTHKKQSESDFWDFISVFMTLQANPLFFSCTGSFWDLGLFWMCTKWNTHLCVYSPPSCWQMSSLKYCYDSLILKYIWDCRLYRSGYVRLQFEWIPFLGQ